MISLTRRYHFSASHRLHSEQLSADQNASLYGKCNNPYGHGHDYALEVTVGGPVDPRTGRVVPLVDLDALVSEHVLRVFAGRNINLDVPQFRSLVPSTENIVVVVRDLLLANWAQYLGNSAARLTRVFVRETGRNSFEINVPIGARESASQTEMEPAYVSR